MDGREQAWMEPMVAAFSRPAFQLAAALVRDGGIAEEIVQEAFLRALVSRHTPREMPEFRRWLYRIVLNLVREHHRRQTRWRRLPSRPESVLDPEREAERRIGDAEMADALRHLSPREREAIYLRFFEDAAYEDVAAIMRIADSTCRVLVHRALDKLRGHLTTQVDQKRETL